MPSITIRNVPEDVRDALAAQAASTGRSLQEHLLAELTALAGRPTVDELLSRIRQRKAATGGHLGGDRILEHLEADRR